MAAVVDHARIGKGEAGAALDAESSPVDRADPIRRRPATHTGDAAQGPASGVLESVEGIGIGEDVVEVDPADELGCRRCERDANLEPDGFDVFEPVAAALGDHNAAAARGQVATQPELTEVTVIRAVDLNGGEGALDLDVDRAHGEDRRELAGAIAEMEPVPARRLDAQVLEDTLLAAGDCNRIAAG